MVFDVVDLIEDQDLHNVTNIKVARRRWTAAHARWALRRWNNVMFSDETKVMIDSSDRRQRVYRRVGERYNEICVVEEDRSGEHR